MYFVTMSSKALLAALDDLRLAAEWVLPHDQKAVQPEQVILRAHVSTRTVELRWAEIQRRLLLELAEVPIWADSIAQLLARNNTGRHPWPSFIDEWKVWA